MGHALGLGMGWRLEAWMGRPLAGQRTVELAAPVA